MTSIPGTLYRAYNADKSKHHTAVLLDNGKLLEVKSADGSSRRIYDSYDAWVSARKPADGSVSEDKSKAKGVVIIPGNTKLFAVPPKCNTGHLAWPYWFYKMMAELTPHLLSNPAVCSAYNNLVSVCEKMDGRLTTQIYAGLTNYDPRYLPSAPHGLYKFASIYRHKNYAEAETLMKLLFEAYKPLYDLVGADLGKQLTFRHSMHSKNLRVGKLHRRLDRIERKAADIKALITKEKADLDILKELYG